MQKYMSNKGSHLFNFFYFCLILGHIHQVKENLSKTPQELIPFVFPNTWGILTKPVLTSFTDYYLYCNCGRCDSQDILRELVKKRPLCHSPLVVMLFQVCLVRSKQRCMESWQPSSMSRLSEILWAVGDVPAAEDPSLEHVSGLRCVLLLQSICVIFYQYCICGNLWNVTF